MSFSELPDVALIKIFRTFEHLELMRIYQSCRHSRRIQLLIENSSSLWMSIHLQSTVDYHLWTSFIRLLVSNASKTRQLTVDQLDLTCRKILLENRFSLRDFTQLESLIIHDQYLCDSLQSLQFCSTTLRTLRLTNEHTNLSHWNHVNHLENLQITLYSIDILQNRLEYLTNLHLKIMFDHDHQSSKIFARLPRNSLQILTLKFLILNNDLHFIDHFHSYLDHARHLHTLELHHLHGMCPVSIHTDFDYSRYQRMILENIVPLKQMKTFLEFHQYHLPLEYLQINPTTSNNQHSSRIQNQVWCDREVILIDYLSCVTTSMDLFNQLNVIWSDKNQRTQSFESYILRSIYNASNIINCIQNLSMSKFELSLNGLIILMTNLPNVREMIITDGRIDQMGAGMSDMEKILRTTTTDVSQSDIRTIVMNQIQLSRRTVVQFCLLTSRLNSLILNDIQFFDRGMNSSENQSNLLVILKQIAQLTEQFRWNDLKSLTFGIHFLHRNIQHLWFSSRKKSSSSCSSVFLHSLVDCE